jgi:hypothetical protein
MTYIKQYFQRELRAPSDLSPSDLVEYPTQLAPTIIEAIITRGARSFWASDLDHKLGLNALAQFGMELLMGAKRDLIKEVRGIRGRDGEDPSEIDIDVVGVGLYSGAQLVDITRKLGPTEGVTVEGQLAGIDDKLQQLIEAGADPETISGILDGITTIITLLG